MILIKMSLGDTLALDVYVYMAALERQAKSFLRKIHITKKPEAEREMRKSGYSTDVSTPGLRCG